MIKEVRNMKDIPCEWEIEYYGDAVNDYARFVIFSSNSYDPDSIRFIKKSFKKLLDSGYVQEDDNVLMTGSVATVVYNFSKPKCVE